MHLQKGTVKQNTLQRKV